MLAQDVIAAVLGARGAGVVGQDPDLRDDSKTFLLGHIAGSSPTSTRAIAGIAATPGNINDPDNKNLRLENMAISFIQIANGSVRMVTRDFGPG